MLTLLVVGGSPWVSDCDHLLANRARSVRRSG
jgi:hypothetical protein